MNDWSTIGRGLLTLSNIHQSTYSYSVGRMCVDRFAGGAINAFGQLRIAKMYLQTKEKVKCSLLQRFGFMQTLDVQMLDAQTLDDLTLAT